MSRQNPKRIIISRTDNLGDVILTLPLAAALKKIYPQVKIIFLGKTYTETIIKRCRAVDEFADWDQAKNKSKNEIIDFFRKLQADVIIHVFPDYQIAKFSYKAGIPMRIGTSHRLYHWIFCNKKVDLPRKKSDLHEAQLNLKLIEPLGGKKEYSLQEIPALFEFNDGINSQKNHAEKFKLILHPGTKGSAREWGIVNFKNLIALLDKDIYEIYITGTEEEGQRFRQAFQGFPNVVDVTGKMNMEAFIAFIFSCDGIVAASTGPLHIAAAAGKIAIGIYAPMRPIFPMRWAPLGTKASYHVLPKSCTACQKSGACACIQSISPLEVKANLENLRMF